MNAVANRRNIEVTKVAHLRGHKGAIYDFVIDKNTEIVYTAGADGLVVAWQANDPIGVSILQTSEPLYSIFIHKDMLLAGSRSGTIYTINLTTKTLPKTEKRHTGGVFFMQNELSGGEDGVFIIGDNKIQLSKDSIRCLVERENDWLIGSSDNSIYRINKSDNSIEAVLQGHTNSVFALCLLDDNTLVSTGRDALIKVWDLTINKEVFSVAAHMYQAKSLSFNGEFLLSSSMDKSIRLWSDKLKLLKVIDFEKNEGHTNCINKVQWLDNKRFVSCSDDRSLIFWQVEINN